MNSVDKIAFLACMAPWIGTLVPYKLVILALGRSQDYQKFKVIYNLSNSKDQPHRSITTSLGFSPCQWIEGRNHEGDNIANLGVWRERLDAL